MAVGVRQQRAAENERRVRDDLSGTLVDAERSRRLMQAIADGAPGGPRRLSVPDTAGMCALLDNHCGTHIPTPMRFLGNPALVRQVGVRRG